MSYVINPNSGMVHSAECRNVRRDWVAYDPGKANLTPGTSPHWGCLPDGLPEPEEAPDVLLTAEEKRAVTNAGLLWNDLCKIVRGGRTRDADLNELAAHIHAIQHAVMANAAARAYPSMFRPLGGMMEKH